MVKTNEKDNKKIKYIALYCRVAISDPKADISEITAQKKQLEHWAKQQGYTPEQIITLIDNGFSGFTLERPGIQQFLSGKQKYAALVAVNLSRFARDAFLIGKIVDHAEVHGTTVYAIKEQTSLNQWKQEWNQFYSALLKGGAGK